MILKYGQNKIWTNLEEEIATKRNKKHRVAEIVQDVCSIAAEVDSGSEIVSDFFFFFFIIIITSSSSTSTSIILLLLLLVITITITNMKGIPPSDCCNGISRPLGRTGVGPRDSLVMVQSLPCPFQLGLPDTRKRGTAHQQSQAQCCSVAPWTPGFFLPEFQNSHLLWQFHLFVWTKLFNSLPLHLCLYAIWGSDVQRCDGTKSSQNLRYGMVGGIC